MAWNYDVSLQRIQNHVAGLGDVEIRKLIREADLFGLLSETCCREIYGAHTYAVVSNFSALASELSTDTDYKRLIQSVHIYQREVSRIVERNDLFAGLRVHFQGPKLHALFYRPIDDSECIAAQAILLQLVLKDFVKSVFNPVFPHCENFVVSAGSALGEVIGTKNGHRGDQELLFIGSSANYAAKIIGSWGSLRVGAGLYDALPAALQDLCVEVRRGVYRVQQLDPDDLAEVLADYDIDWHPDASAQRIDDDKKAFPLKDIAYSNADVLIDPNALSIRNNKRVLAASVFADISGFTRYVDAAQTDNDKATAIRVLHAIRKEMATVVKKDFGGVRVQYQGDRVQALFHLPKGDETNIARRAVEAAIGLQSSMEYTIKEVLPEAQDLRLAVGVDLGTTLLSKLGTRGQRDRICLGVAVENAAICEERCAGGQIGVTETVWQALPESLQQQFNLNESAGCYTADDLTARKAQRASRAAVYAVGGSVHLRAGHGGISVSREEAPNARIVTPSRSWAE